jgi:thioredoxin reductase
MTHTDVLVVGTGPTGLTLAVQQDPAPLPALQGYSPEEHQ